jgi:hypothetical protein
MLVVATKSRMTPITAVAALLLSCVRAGGQDVPPPPKPTDDGPNLEVTMKFIEDKLRSIGRLNYIGYIHDNEPPVSRWLDLNSDTITVSRSGTALTLRYSNGRTASGTLQGDFTMAVGFTADCCVGTISEDGSHIDWSNGTTWTSVQPGSTNGRDWQIRFSTEVTDVRASVTDCRIDYHWRENKGNEVTHDKDSRVLLKDVRAVVVKTRDLELKEADSKAGHPEWTSRVDPPVFVVSLSGPDSVFYLYDESLANRMAKALVHGVELCGGGSKDPF